MSVFTGLLGLLTSVLKKNPQKNQGSQNFIIWYFALKMWLGKKCCTSMKKVTQGFIIIWAYDRQKYLQESNW